MDGRTKAYTDGPWDGRSGRGRTDERMDDKDKFDKSDDSFMEAIVALEGGTSRRSTHVRARSILEAAKAASRIAAAEARTGSRGGGRQRTDGRNDGRTRQRCKTGYDSYKIGGMTCLNKFALSPRRAQLRHVVLVTRPPTHHYTARPLAHPPARPLARPSSKALRCVWFWRCNDEIGDFFFSVG